MADDQIDVKLGATDEGLKSGMDDAAQATEQAAASMGDAFKAMAAKVSEAMAEVGAQVKEGVAQSKESLEGFATAISGVQKMFALLGEVAVLGFVGEKVAETAREFAEWGDQMEHTTAQTGLTVEAVQQLQFAGKSAGLSAQDMDLSMVHLARSLYMAQQGSTQAVDAFRNLGISASDLKGLSLDQTLSKIADAFQAHADGANKAAVAQALFGRSGYELIAFLDKGSTGIQSLRDEATKLGIVMGEDDVQQAVALHQQLVVMDSEMQTMKLRIGGELAPAFTAIAQAMVDVTGKGGPMTEFFTALANVFKVVVAAGISVVEVFELISTTIARAAQAVYDAAHGNFSMAFADIKGGLQELKTIATDTGKALKDLFTTQKTEAPAEGEGGANKPQVGSSSSQRMGEAEKLAQAMLALKVAQEKADYDLTKQGLDEAQKLNDDAYANGLISVKQYYDAKLALTQADLNAQIQMKQQEVAAAQKAEATAQATSGRPGGEEAVLKARATLVTLTGQLSVLEDRLANSGVENAAKRADAERKLNDTIEKDTISTQEKIADDTIASQKAVAESRYNMGLTTKDQLLQIEQQLEEQKYQIAREAIQKRLALEDTATYKNPAAIAQLNNQLLALDAQYNNSVIQNQAKLQEALAKPYTTMIDGVKNQFETGIADMLNGTKTFSQGLSAILTGVVQAFDKMIAQMLVQWVQSELTKTAATTSAVGARSAFEVGSVATTTAAHAVGAAAQVSTTVTAEGAKTGAVVAGNAVRTASDWAAALESTAATAWAAIKNIATKAWEVAASVYSAIAAIPYVGPFLAPAMALAAVGTVIAFAGNIASAEGGYDIPSGVNPVTQLHEQEMVLPKAQADVIRRMSNMAMSEGQKTQGDTHVHIHAVDAQSFEKRLSAAGGTLQSMIRQAHRDGKGGQLRYTWGATG